MEIVTRGGNVLQIRGDWDAPVNHGLLCKMGRFEPLYDGRERVTEPLLRNKEKLEPVSWEKAFDVMVKQIGNAKANETGVLASSYATNEALYLINKLFSDKLKVSNIGLPICRPRDFRQRSKQVGRYCQKRYYSCRRVRSFKRPAGCFLHH